MPSTFSELRSATAPPATSVRPSGRVAMAVTSATLMAMAAATATLPSEVDADGLALPFAPCPLYLTAVVEAKSRWSCACLSTSPDGALGSLLPGAPLAEALADAPSAD